MRSTIAGLAIVTPLILSGCMAAAGSSPDDVDKIDETAHAFVSQTRECLANNGTCGIDNVEPCSGRLISYDAIEDPVSGELIGYRSRWLVSEGALVSLTYDSGGAWIEATPTPGWLSDSEVECMRGVVGVPAPK